MPSYDSLMNTPGVFSHTWGTTNDAGQRISSNPSSTNAFTLTSDNAVYTPAPDIRFAELAKKTEAGYYHRPLSTLRGILAGFPACESAFFEDAVADYVCAGLSPYDPQAANPDDVAQRAQVWCLAHFDNIREEEARVMCGYGISRTAGKDDISGTVIASQFDRLFGKQGTTLLSTKDLTEFNRILMRAYGVNNDDLNMLLKLDKVDSINADTIASEDKILGLVSSLYGWVLLSRALGCSFSGLSLLNSVTAPAKTWLRYTAFRSALDWLAKQHLDVAALTVLTASSPTSFDTVLTTLTDTLRHESTAKDRVTRQKLADAVASAFGMSSVSQSDALLSWLDTDISSTGMNSAKFIAAMNKTPVRYIMLRRSASDYLVVQELEVLVNGVNIALNKTVTIGQQGAYDSSSQPGNIVDGTDKHYSSSNPADTNKWIQVDLGAEYPVDCIRLTPYSPQVAYMTECQIYVADTDMRDWVGTSKPGDTDPRYTLLGKTASTGQPAPQTFTPDLQAQTYLNQLALYALVTGSLGLSEDTVRALVDNGSLISGSGSPMFSLQRLRDLQKLQAVAALCEADAPVFLKQLSGKILQVSGLARFTRQDESVLTAALPAGTKAGDILTFVAVRQTLDTVALSQRTGLSLSHIASLRTLKKDSAFSLWYATAMSLMADLSGSVRTSLEQTLAEELSAVLTKLQAHASSQVAPGELVKDADYFLIDPQLSGQTQTSPLAWAIAAVQLYVDRCLNGEEPDVSSTAKETLFFENWDRYNKRYGQWAGLKRLLWEPENYIDPSLRLQPTEAFTHLQQLLDSGPLNEETAGEAFDSYLTEFELMSEVIPVSGWHDNVDATKGNTWLLGMSRDKPVQWFWRTVDQSKLSAGSLPVHAWTGWQKIDLPVKPMIIKEFRPFINLLCLNNRLHLVWLEKSEHKDPKDNSKNVVKYTLKESHQRYDKSWSAPSEGIDINPVSAPSIPALSCTTYPEKNCIVVNLREGSTWANDIYKGALDRNGHEIPGNYDDIIHAFPSYATTVDSEHKLNEQQLVLGRPYSGGLNENLYLTQTVEGDFELIVSYTEKDDDSDKTFIFSHIYILSSNFPARLLTLNAMGTEAVFALTEDRKDPTKLSKQLDFYGPNGPYFWELFYHVPLLISQRLSLAQDYIGATRWLEYVFNPANSNAALPVKGVRYIMLRRGLASCFDVAEVEVMVDGINIAKNATATVGPQGDKSGDVKNIIDGDPATFYAASGPENNANNNKAWVQIDLGKLYPTDAMAIRLTPRIKDADWSARMTECYVYAADTDMKDWVAGPSKPGDTDPHYSLIGKTATTPQKDVQTFNLEPYWKPLPLHNDVVWNVVDTSTTDPDIIAETDPMHYKLATFMHALDLLMARGDAAYRLQERDTLVEAGMWYQQAQRLLGERTEPAGGKTVLPALALATDTTHIDYLSTHFQYFQPQENEKLSGYWQLIRHRLFNLRHNLSIDGEPLSLPLYAKPANPADLLSAALTTASGMTDLPAGKRGLLRFKPALEQARGLAGQLVQFGSTLLGISERQDAEAMNQLLQTQAGQLLAIAGDMQSRTLNELDASLDALRAQRDGVSLRQTYYQTQYDGNISGIEESALTLNKTSAGLLIGGGASFVVGGALDMVPNIYGLADGGMRWGALANGIGSMLSNTAFSLSTTAGVLTETDAYRRRRDEWKLQLDSAENELKQLDKQEAALNARREATGMQRDYLQTQQRQMTEQLQLLKSRFTSQQLYSWLRSRLSTIFWQFYDVSVTAALRAEQSWQFETGQSSQRFIRPGAWQQSSGGLLCGESLLLDLAHMEKAWLDWDKRALEVTRTVSLAEVLKHAKPGDAAVPGLTDGIRKILATPSATCTWADATIGSLTHGLHLNSGEGTLDVGINLAALNIPANYPSALGAVRRIKNISVSLPALVGPYQDIRAVLTYSESGVTLPAGCGAIAVSHGVNDSGQFQLDFNDPRYLPFEGVVLPAPAQDNQGTLTLRFPSAQSDQKALLSSLNDIILHIRYTIRD